jgi:aromatic-L-amino-acid/L-tryptophan decarboxylase
MSSNGSNTTAGSESADAKAPGPGLPQLPQLEPVGHMSAAEFRQHGHDVVDAIADYFETIEKHPVRSEVEPGYLRKLVPDSAPQDGEKWEDIMKDVQSKIVPGLTHWQSPNFFAYYPGNTCYPAIMGEMLAQSFNVIGFSWINSPACTELETIVLDWLAKVVNLPDSFLSNGKGCGIIQGTASEATLVALLSARTRTLNRLVAEQAPESATPEELVALKHKLSKKLIAYGSDQAHSSLNKAFMIAGLPQSQLRLIPTDKASDFAMTAEAVRKAVDADVKEGLVPFFMFSTVGTTSSCAFDPVDQIAPIGNEHQMWNHVDAAYAGSAAVCPEFQHIFNGVDQVDSVSFNTHKWLLTPFDCAPMWVKNRSELVDALGITPEYLRNKHSEAGSVIDYRDLQVPLGRRFRSLKLWFVMRWYGVKNMQTYIRNHVKMAQQFEQYVTNDERKRFELVAPRGLSLTCFRLLPSNASATPQEIDALNQKLLDKINETGKIFVIHTRLDNKMVIRFAVGAVMTEPRHVADAWSLISATADELLTDYE